MAMAVGQPLASRRTLRLPPLLHFPCMRSPCALHTACIHRVRAGSWGVLLRQTENVPVGGGGLAEIRIYLILYNIYYIICYISSVS